MPCGFLEEFAYLLLLDVVVVVVTADLLSYHSVLLSPARVISKSVGDALHDEKGQTSRRVKNRPPRNSRQITGTRFRSCMTSSSSSSSTASLDIHTHTYINMLFLFRVVFVVCLLFALLFFLGHGFWGTPLGKEKALFRIRGSRTLFGSDWGSFLVLFWSSSSSPSSFFFLLLLLLLLLLVYVRFITTSSQAKNIGG